MNVLVSLFAKSATVKFYVVGATPTIRKDDFLVSNVDDLMGLSCADLAVVYKTLNSAAVLTKFENKRIGAKRVLEAMFDAWSAAKESGDLLEDSVAAPTSESDMTEENKTLSAKAPKAPKSAKAPKAAKPAKVAKAPKAAKAAKEPKAAKAPKAAKEPKAPKTEAVIKLLRPVKEAEEVLPPQALTLLGAFPKVGSTLKVSELLAKVAGSLATKQTPMRIWQFYRPKMLAGGFISIGS